MHLVRHMKSSTSESKSNFCRFIRLAQSNRTAGRPKYKSVDPNWFIRRSLHAPNQMIRFGSCKVRRMNRAWDFLSVIIYCYDYYYQQQLHSLDPLLVLWFLNSKTSRGTMSDSKACVAGGFYGWLTRKPGTRVKTSSEAAGKWGEVPRGEAARWRGFAATVAVLSPFHPQLHHSF